MDVRIILGFFAFMAIMCIFGDNDGNDTEETKKFKAAQKTKQMEYQWKIDSTKAAQSKR